MNASAALDARFLEPDAPSFSAYHDAINQENMQTHHPRQSRNAAILPSPRSDVGPTEPQSTAAISETATTTLEQTLAPKLEIKRKDGCNPPLREDAEKDAKHEIHGTKPDAEPQSSACHDKRKGIEALTPIFNGARAQHGKRRRLEVLAAVLNDADGNTGTPRKRKGNGDFLRKGQWTGSEERLARMLIEAFEDGYLPIYTGIRLRGYLAVQLQCDPMRVSKKLCAGVVDGKAIPKNYGQKKFALRQKPFWDHDKAVRVVAALEQQAKEMWRDSAMTPPAFLSLSSTRNSPEAHAVVAVDEETSSSRNKCSPQGAVAKKQQGVVFPIIYLNLSKKRKQQSLAAGDANSATTTGSSEGSGGAKDVEPVKVDGESLQAAYNLLRLCQPDASLTSRG